MEMRVVAGSFKGRPLLTPPGCRTRPTAGKVREAIFSSLMAETPGSVWLDLFAGSGAMGIEALSRGAAYCFFADDDRLAWAVIRKNLATLGLGPDRARLFKADAEKACALIAAEHGQIISVAYLDPPYGDQELYGAALALLPALLAPEGLVVIEHRRDWQPVLPWAWPLKTREYGRTGVSYYRKGRV